MDPREISARLHDVLRTACRVRQPGPGRSAENNIESIDAVKGALRSLIADLSEQEPPRLPPRIQATASAFPEGRIAGTRATVQHRRRTRGPVSENPTSSDGTRSSRLALCPEPIRLPSPRAAAEALFRRAAATGERAGATGFRR